MRSVALLISFLFFPTCFFAQSSNSDSIGFSIYDYLTNGSPTHNLINIGDGTLQFARMAGTDSATVGIYFKCFDGTSWSTDWSPIPASRGGTWGSISTLADAGAVSVVVSHPLTIDVDAAFCADVWTNVAPDCENSLWPRMAIGSGFTLHVIATENPPQILGYHRSPDAGSTWLCDVNLITHPGVVIAPDGYDITAQGEKIAIIVAGAGGDVCDPRITR